MDKNNAHALLQLAMLAHKDPVETMDPLVMLVLQVPMDNRAVLDQLDLPAQLVIQEMQEPQDQQEMPVTLLQAVQAQLAQLDLMATQAHLAQLVNPVDLVMMAALVLQALQEMLVLQVVLAMLAVQAVQANLVTMVLQAVANTAHPLVWLQVIKRRQQVQFSGNIEYLKTSIDSKRPSLSSSVFFPITYPLVVPLRCLSFLVFAFFYAQKNYAVD